MYISQFSAFNFRSLKSINIRLAQGKNVIVGKNNSGKSNIIRGIEILVGEKLPTYQNITNNDFYTYESVDTETSEVKEIVADNMYLEATLDGRDLNESLIMSIKKQTAFSKVSNTRHLYYKNEHQEIVVNYDLFQNLDDLENRDEISILETFSSGKEKRTEWKTASRLYEFLVSAKTIKIFFCKSRIDEEKAGTGLIVKDNEGNFWITHFLSKKLRDSLLTTTVISALRSHKDELRLVHYTWFGKLISGIWHKNKTLVDDETGKSYEDLIKESASFIKSHVDIVFASNTNIIRKLLEGAISHKTISFKFMDDGKNEMYKNIQLFVNDGIDRPIQEKGTGIQSAVIIALFSLYCNEFHNNSSLLIAEEPELFLHPQARRVISAELNKFLIASEAQERQLIISTHSTEYLKNAEPINITRVYKDVEQNCSFAKQLDEGTNGLITNELKRFLWSNNTEIFFADKVILVEGGEVFLIPSIVDKVTGINQKLDYENISVARVNGKGSFLIYAKILDCFQISYLILGDLDCFKDEIRKLVQYLNLEDIKPSAAAIKSTINSMDIDYSAIDDRIRDVAKNYDAQNLKDVFEKFSEGSLLVNDESLLSIISYMQARYTKGNKLEAIYSEIGNEEFERVLKSLRENKIFIWSKGELEDYYQQEVMQLIGSKDIKALRLSYLLQERDATIEQYFAYPDEIIDLCNFILPPTN